MKLIAGAKAVLFPSVSEGFGFAAYEASVMGKIILHSGRGALGEVVSGRSVRMKEYTAKGLSEAIWAVENSEITTTETTAFPVSRMTSEYLGLYREVLSE
jgi:glycosyltransferase involved in cell wall biosynthesis